MTCPECKKQLEEEIETCTACGTDHHAACLDHGVCTPCAQRSSPSVSEMDTENLDGVFECGVCEQTFPKRSLLNVHVKTHDGGGRHFRCKVCAASFQRKHDLKRHERRHTNARPFTCSVCDKSFSRADALHRHERSIHKSGSSQKDASTPRAKTTRAPSTRKRPKKSPSASREASPTNDAEAVAVLSDMLRTRASSTGPGERGASPMEKRFRPPYKSGLSKSRLDTDDDYRYTGDSDYEDEDEDDLERRKPVDNYYETYPEPVDRMPTIPYAVPQSYPSQPVKQEGVYSDYHLSSAEDDLYADAVTTAAQVLSSQMSPAFPATLRQGTMSPIIDPHIPSHPPRPLSGHGQRARTRSVEGNPVSPSTFAFGPEQTSLAHTMGIHAFRGTYRLDTASPVPMGSPAVDVANADADPPEFQLTMPAPSTVSPLLGLGPGLRIPRAATPTRGGMPSPSPLRAAVANSMAQAQRSSSSATIGDHVRLESSEQDVAQSPLMVLSGIAEQQGRQSPAPTLPPPAVADEDDLKRVLSETQRERDLLKKERDDLAREVERRSAEPSPQLGAAYPPMAAGGYYGYGYPGGMGYQPAYFGGYPSGAMTPPTIHVRPSSYSPPDEALHPRQPDQQ